MDKITTQSIGDRIKISRQKLGLSQSEISRIMCLSMAICGQWERGIANPSTAHLARLAKILGVPFEYLATGNDTSEKVDFLSGANQSKILKAKMNTLFDEFSLPQQQNIVNFLQGLFDK